MAPRPTLAVVDEATDDAAQVGQVAAVVLRHLPLAANASGLARRVLPVPAPQGVAPAPARLDTTTALVVAALVGGHRRVAVPTGVAVTETVLETRPAATH